MYPKQRNVSCKQHLDISSHFFVMLQKMFFSSFSSFSKFHVLLKNIYASKQQQQLALVSFLNSLNNVLIIFAYILQFLNSEIVNFCTNTSLHLICCRNKAKNKSDFMNEWFLAKYFAKQLLRYAEVYSEPCQTLWWSVLRKELSTYPLNIYLLKVNNRSIRKRCEICSKLKKRHWCLYG